ncbi:translocation/assembly module TamB domain-containing protein, partial [Candidatus Riflebacteria bacterium]
VLGYQGLDFQKVSFKPELQKTGIKLNDLNFLFDNKIVKGEVFLGLNRGVKLTLAGTDLDIDTLRPFFPAIPADLSGKCRVSLHAMKKDDLAEWKVELKCNLPSLFMAGKKMPMIEIKLYKTGRYYFLDLKGADGNTEVSTYFYGKGKHFVSSGRIEAGLLDRFFPFLRLGNNPFFNSNDPLSFELEGTYDPLKRSAPIIKKGIIKWDRDKGKLILGVNKNGIHLIEVSLSSALFFFSGIKDEFGNFNFKFEASADWMKEKFPPLKLPFTASTINMEGSFLAELSRISEEIFIKFNVKEDNGPGEFTGLLLNQGKDLFFKDVKISLRKAGTIFCDGKLGNLKSFHKREFIPDLNLYFQLSKVGLPEFHPLLPDLPFKEGKVDGKIRVFGTFPKPYYEGRLDYSELRFKNEDSFPMKIPKISGSLHLKDRQITFANTMVPLDSGFLRLAGEFHLKELEPHFYQISIHGEKIALKFKNLDIQNADVDLSLVSEAGKKALRGIITINKSRLLLGRTNFFSRPIHLKDYRPDGWLFDIDIHIPNNLRINSPSLNTEVKGQLKLDLDKGSQMKILGELSTLRGHYNFQNRIFNFLEGNLRFRIEDSYLIPFLFVRSQYELRNKKIFLVIKGNIMELKHQFSSLPPLPQEEILRILAVGEETTQVGSNLINNEIFGTIKQRFFSSDLNETIRSSFDLEYFSLESRVDGMNIFNETRVKAGKYLSKELYLQIEKELYDKKNQDLTLQYQAPDNLTYSLDYKERERQFRVGMQYNWSF